MEKSCDQMNPWMQPQQPPLHSLHPLQPRQPPMLPGDQVVFDDDEQLGRSASGEGASNAGVVVVKTHTEYSAIARDDSSRDNFAVLVHLKAPSITDAAGAAGRAPVDLVTVLDVSMSMKGSKLALLKQAMGFVIDSLGPDDRLCVVSFSSRPGRVTRLTRMSDAGKALCARAVESLGVSGGTNIADGLRTAAKVLDERRHRNAVSSIVLLTDGQDNYTMMRMRRAFGSREANYEALIPPSFLRAGTGDWSAPAPIHTFGFGNDHDAAAMHAVAEATSGTFSFIENEAVIQDAFAQCIGGLLSVVVQEARVAIECAHPGVRISSVKSGRYESRVDEDGRAASVGVGELYADEERRFLLFLVVPRAEETDGDTATLVKVTCSYRDAATGADIDVTTAEDTVVARPEHVLDHSERLSVEVERERVRVEATEDMAAARAAADRGAHGEAVKILENRRQAVEQSEAARSGDPMTVALEMELREMCVRVSNRGSYGSSGRAYMLAGMGAHMRQRGTGSGQMLLGDTMPYATPAMLAMLRRSREAREAAAAESRQQQQTTVAGEEAERSKDEGINQ